MVLLHVGTRSSDAVARQLPIDTLEASGDRFVAVDVQHPR
jgi:hypothetical protein